MLAMDLPVRSTCAVALLLTTSCVLGPEPMLARSLREGTYCASPLPLRPGAFPTPDVASPTTHAVEVRGYTPRAIDTARWIGALDPLERLAEAEARGSPRAETADLRGQVNDVIAVAMLDVSSVVANIECEEGRANHVAAELRDAEERQTRRLTAYSLVLSAGTAIAGGVLAISEKNQTPAGVVGIGGGVAAGTFGVATLQVHRTTTFRHPRDILGQVWRGDAHSDFPESVWAYLSRPELTENRERSRRDYLVQGWKESGWLGDDAAHPAPGLVALHFGDGGTYDADGLTHRADMLSSVSEVANLMSHDLQYLASEAAYR